MTLSDADHRTDATAALLDRLAAAFADRLGLADEARKLSAKATQVRDDRFRVLVVGEFKRGKSTLLNAMLGADVLPRKVTPCTAVVTLIQYGEPPLVTVAFDDGRAAETMAPDEFRKRYELTVDDTADAFDRFKSVDHAAIRYPVEICRHRVELVDSPGLGEHATRSRRTQRFLSQADAVVLCLNAKQFMSEEEVHFLEAVLLPLGLKNIFFVVNGWNLIDESVLRPEDADEERANLEALIRQRLTPFCVVNGVDRSADRIFRVNALGALKARARPSAASAGMLEESGVPAFEAAVQRFLLHNRAKARADVVLGVARAAAAEAERYAGTQLALADKSAAEIEANVRAVEPKLERLRGIRRHITNFLEGQSAVLQDRLVTSLQEHVRKIEATLPDEVAKFDLKPLLGQSLTWAAVTNWARKDEEKFEAKAERCIKPQVQRMLERRFADWQQGVVRNEMAAVMVDVEKHLQEEAAEYQRVMREVEEQVGFHGTPLQMQEQVERWLGGGPTGGASQFRLAGLNIMGEFVGTLLAGVVAEVIAQTVMHIATGGVTLIVTAAVALLRIGHQELSNRSKLQEKIVAAVAKGLGEMGLQHAASIRDKVATGFAGLEAKVTGSINDEIAVIDASLRNILEQKRSHAYSADEQRARLEAARADVTAAADELRTLLAGV